MNIDTSQVYKVVDGNGFRVFIGNAEITKVKGIACGDPGDGGPPTVVVSLFSPNPPKQLSLQEWTAMQNADRTEKICQCIAATKRIKYLFLYDSTYPSLDAVLSSVDEIEQLLRELKS